VLVQEVDTAREDRATMTVAGRVRPSEEDWDDLVFAWTVAKHLKSNAVALANRGQLVGMGAGQTSRVEAVEMAARRAGDRAVGSVLASDGFFPFRDNLDVAAKAGVRAVVQPGGSIRDAEVIAAADEHGIPMVFTGVRHFRH
jgi:phosphoribosylaminoimidazolecarboxamide formyltransferase/IMP cyclohydrolase